MTAPKALHAAAGRFSAHAVNLWGDWWFLPLLPAAYAGIMAAVGNLRPQHIVVALLAIGFGYSTARARRILTIAFPVLLVIVAYDILHFAQSILVTPERIAGCSMRNLELAFFAVAKNTTLQDYFTLHHAPLFDLYFAVPYGIFFYVIIAYAGYLTATDQTRARQFVWAIGISYVLAITAWLVVPVAPPWYVQIHGCAIDTAAPASAAGLVRVDHLLGTQYFEMFYAQSPAIFGAFPSMHCSFPVIGLLIAWPRATWATRPIHVVYAASMFAGSIYLDHHWTIDGLGGWMLAAASVGSARLIVPARSVPSSDAYSPAGIPAK